MSDNQQVTRVEQFNMSLYAKRLSGMSLAGQLIALLLTSQLKITEKNTEKHTKINLIYKIVIVTTRSSSTLNDQLARLCQKSAFSKMLSVTDLLTPNSNQLIFVPDCTEVVNMVIFPQAVYKTMC